jgi:hypothetical protein
MNSYNSRCQPGFISATRVLMLTKLQRHPSILYSAHNLNCQGCLLFPWLIHCLLIANNASILVNGGHELATYHTSLKLILQCNLAPFCVHEGVIWDNILCTP